MATATQTAHISIDVSVLAGKQTHKSGTLCSLFNSTYPDECSAVSASVGLNTKPSHSMKKADG